MGQGDRIDRLLVFHTGGIGDLVLACPAIAALRKRFPRARVTGVGYPERLELLQACGLLDECASIDGHGFFHLFGGRRQPLGSVVDYLHGTDLVVSWVSDIEGNFEHNLRRAGVPEVVIGQPIPPSDSPLHAVDNYLACLGVLGVVPGPKPEARLSLPARWICRAEEELAAFSPGRPVMGMLPGSGSARKNWPRERFRDVAERLIQRVDASVVIFLGPAERERGDADFWQRAGEGGMMLIVERSLVEVAALLGELNVFVGCDSGLSHLAAALRTPVVALFGPTDPAMWAPRGPHVRVVAGDDGSMAAISVESVFDVVARLLSDPHSND